MSKSFKVEGGDLVIGAGRSYEQVSGSRKLAQDLRLAVLERIGFDPATPTFGSRLDGGVIDGTEVPSFIGRFTTDEVIAEIRAEVTAVLAQYQQAQLQKMSNDIVEFDGKHTLTDDEVLSHVESVEATNEGTQVIVRVTCETLAGNRIRLTIPTQV